MIFGYARVSKKEQNISLQTDALKEYNVDVILEEKISAAKKRPEFEKLLSKLKAGDTLIVWKLDRLGRTTNQLMQLAEYFEKNDIKFISIKENFDTSTIMGKFTFNIFCALAQMERDVLIERTNAGLASARLQGRIGGRKSVSDKTIEKAIKMYKSNSFSVGEILETTGISKSTLYKYLNK